MLKGSQWSSSYRGVLLCAVNCNRASILCLQGILNLSYRFEFIVWLLEHSKFFPFDLRVRLGKNGVEEVLGLGELSDFEKEGLENLKGELKPSIADYSSN